MNVRLLASARCLILLAAACFVPALADELPSTPQGLADHLNGILNSDLPMQEMNDTYEDIWADIPDDVREEIKEIWRAEEEAQWERQQAQWERKRVEELKSAGEEWATHVADFSVTTTVSGRNGDGDTVYQEAGADIAEARQYYGPQIQALGEDAKNLQGQLQEEVARRDNLQDNLDSHLENRSLWESLDFSDDHREEYLQGQIQAAEERIASLHGQIAGTVETMDGLNRQLESYENAVVLDAVKKDEELLAADAQRVDATRSRRPFPTGTTSAAVSGRPTPAWAWRPRMPWSISSAARILISWAMSTTAPPGATIRKTSIPPPRA